MRYVDNENKVLWIHEIRSMYPNLSIPNDADLTNLGFNKLILTEAPIAEGFSSIEVAPINNTQTWELIPNQADVVQIPQAITPLQAKLQLFEMGLLDEVDALVSNDRKVQLYWEYALVIERNNPILLVMSGLLGLTEEQLDNMFIAASKL